MALEHTENRRARIAYIRALVRKHHTDAASALAAAMHFTDEQEQLLSWLSAPDPTEPVLVELGGRTLPAVKFALEHGIFALYVMECIEGLTLEDSMTFAGLYDPKAVLLYTDGASPILSDLPFASSEDLRDTFLDAAACAFEAVAEQTEADPARLGDETAEVWDVFLRTFPETLHATYVEGGSAQDVLRLYTKTLVEDLLPPWTRDLAASFLGDEDSMTAEFLKTVPQGTFALGACVCRSLRAYWRHIAEHRRHPAHRLREIAGACEASRYEFVQIDLVNERDGCSNSIAFPKRFLPNGSFGAFDTRSWPETVREQLKATFPESYGCFHVSDIRRARELFTGRVLFEAPPLHDVCRSAWDTADESEEPGASAMPRSS